MQQVEKYISNLIPNQFPSIYKEEGKNLVAFIQAYYEWLEVTGNPLYEARTLPEYSDIDRTVEDFIIHFKNTYLEGIQFDTLSEKRLTVKKILDLYKAKGNIRAIKLLFQLVFNEDIEIYFPGDDILAPSDGTWIIPKYLEVTHSARNSEFEGKLVTGVTSGATAVVDRIVKKSVTSNYLNANNITEYATKYIDVFYLTNLRKDFQTGELLQIDTNLNGVPTVVGSLSDFVIDEGGYGFSVGDIVSLESSAFGYEGKGIVTKVKDVSGIVSFTLVDGGWGYTNSSSILISNTNLYLSNLVSNNITTTLPINKFSTVTINNPANNAANATANVFAYGTVVNVYVNSASLSGSFVLNESVSSSDNAANGKIIGITANTTTTVLNISRTSNGYFATNVNVIGTTSNAQGNVVGLDMKIGVVSLVGTVTNNHTKLYTTTGNATIVGESTGIDANFIISTVNSTESTYLNDDFINGNNISSVKYTTIALNASTYGFPKKPSGNVTNGYLVDILNYPLKNLGEITSITTVNPGKNYNDSPFVEIFEPLTGASGRQDYFIDLSNLSGGFTLGEQITQTVPAPADYFNLSISGTLGTFVYGEKVYQSNGTANIATATVISPSTSSMVVSVLTGAFVPTAGVYQKVRGLSSSANATITSVSGTGLTKLAIGKVKTANTSRLSVARQSILQNFVSGYTITGALSAATANASFVDTDTTSRFAGDNANVTARTFSSSGTVDIMKVYNSGFGYTNSEIITFRSSDKTRVGTARGTLGKQGVAEGYYASTQGFTSSNKYIQDGNYYQNFSYEVRSKLDLTRYSEMVKQVVHVAGTRLFGAVVKKSNVNTSITVDNSNIGPIIG